MKDGKSIAHGEDFASAVKIIHDQVAARDNQNLVAIGVNCINPDFVSELFEPLKGKFILVVYPNSGEKDQQFSGYSNNISFKILGETYNVETGWDGKNNCKSIDDYVVEWTHLGAKFIGGCCRSEAKDIKKIKEKVKSLQRI